MDFWQLYSKAALTSLGFFWQALWAFVLGYVISSAIQVFVTRQRMQQAMGKAGRGSIALGTFFGFISSSCSFAALATTKALFQKGADFVSSLAFLLASTNLVIELGFIIAVFLGWQFVVGEYVGGILLILFMWAVVRFTRPKKLIRSVQRQLQARESDGGGQTQNWKEKIQTIKGWRQVARKYFMEWKMVWKDVSIGFTVAGIIAIFVPRAFFETLFLAAGEGNNPSFLVLLEQVIVGPLAAFFTFIGSMGNIPLASVLYSNGVSFAGVMAFIFSDLVVLPVIRINAKYYGWKLALYIVGVFLVALVLTALALHYSFAALGILPEVGGGQTIAPLERFSIDYTFWLNIIAVAVTGVLAWLAFGGKQATGKHHHDGGNGNLVEKVLFYLTMIAYIWLLGGAIAAPFVLS